jgi:hypothetical protein
MSKKIQDAIQDAVKRGSAIKAQIKDLSAELKEIETFLIEAGGGEDADGHTAKVIESTPVIAAPEDIEDAKALAGEHFGKLFEVVKTHKPVKSFREVAAALLGKKAGKLIALCEKPKAAWLKWS